MEPSTVSYDLPYWMPSMCGEWAGKAAIYLLFICFVDKWWELHFLKSEMVDGPTAASI